MLVAISPEGRAKDKLRMMGSGSVRVTGQAVGGCNGTRCKYITRTYARYLGLARRRAISARRLIITQVRFAKWRLACDSGMGWRDAAPGSGDGDA